MLKLIELCTNKDIKCQKNVGTFVDKASELRKKTAISMTHLDATLNPVVVKTLFFY